MGKITSIKLRKEIQDALNKTRTRTITVKKLRNNVEKKLKCSLLKRKSEFADIVLDYITGIKMPVAKVKASPKPVRKIKFVPKKKVCRKQNFVKKAKDFPRQNQKKKAKKCAAVKPVNRPNFLSKAMRYLNQENQKKNCNTETDASEVDLGCKNETPSLAESASDEAFVSKAISFYNKMEKKRKAYGSDTDGSESGVGKNTSEMDANFENIALRYLSRLQNKTEANSYASESNSESDSDASTTVNRERPSRRSRFEEENFKKMALSYLARLENNQAEASYNSDTGSESDSASEDDESESQTDLSDDENTHDESSTASGVDDEVDNKASNISDSGETDDDSHHCDILSKSFESDENGDNKVRARKPVLKRVKPTRYALKSKRPKYTSGNEFESDTDFE